MFLLQTPDPLALTGRSATHVVALQGTSVLLHRDVLLPFLALREAARAEGIDLVPVSGFRDFARQRLIWNAKCRGERELLDRDGQRLDARALAPAALVEAVLGWSALPGASRHHWGTDLDVMDAAALAPGQQPRLVPAEFAPSGVFGPLQAWLAVNLPHFGFFRPYQRDLGGVQPEPWHLSHAALAAEAQQALSLAVLHEALAGADLEQEAEVMRRLPQLYERYVCNVAPVPAAALAATALTWASRPS